MSYPTSFYQQDDQLYKNDWSFACTDAACSINWLAHQCNVTGTPELAHINRDDLTKPRPIKGMNSSITKFISVEDVVMITLSGQSLTLQQVFYVPDTTIRLISVGKLCR